MKRFTVEVENGTGSLIVADFHTKRAARQWIEERSKYTVQDFTIVDAEA